MTNITFEGGLASNFYPPEGFYSTGSYDHFLVRNQTLFLAKIRFSVSYFHRLMTALELKDKYFTNDTGKNV